MNYISRFLQTLTHYRSLSPKQKVQRLPAVAPRPSEQPGVHSLTQRHGSSFTRAIIYFFLGHIFQTLLTQSVLSIHLLQGLSSAPFPEAPSYNFFTHRSLFKCLLRPAHRRTPSIHSPLKSMKGSVSSRTFTLLPSFKTRYTGCSTILHRGLNRKTY